MIEKAQYSDFNRFLVSIGIILIGIGILFPYLYMKEDFGLLIENDEILKLTPVAQDIVRGKQIQIQNLISYIPFVAGGSILLGIIISTIGLYKWKSRQKIEDNRLKSDLNKTLAETEKTKIEKLKISKDIEEMSKSEVENLRISEIEKNQPKLSEIEKDLSLTNYVLIESLIADKFRYEYSYKYNVFSNYRINKQEFDLILEYINSDTNSMIIGKDVIVEIKYVRTITKKIVKDTFLQVGAMLKAYPKAITNPVIFFVYRDNKKEISKENLLSSIIEEWSVKTINKWSVHFIDVADLPALKLKDILYI